MKAISKRALLAVGLLLASSAYAEEVEFHQSVDRDEVGTEDTFRLTVVVANAPDGAELRLPSSEDFEVLSRSQSTQMSYQLGGGGLGTLRRAQTYVLVMRANKAGTLAIPPSVLTGSGRSYRTEEIKIKVKPGRLSPPPSARAPQSPFGQMPNPFRGMPFPGFPDDFEEPLAEPDIDIPRSDSDLFLRSTIDRTELYAGEQATLSVYVYSRVDLSSVDKFVPPKLDGFWSEDLKSPTQLTAESKVVDGVPYRAYLLRRWAIFPVKAGKYTLAPAEAELTSGVFFDSRRVRRKGNAVELIVKPLPDGAPKGFVAGSVGNWRISLEASPAQVRLGDPVTVRVVIDGEGNLKQLGAPKFEAPPSVKVYEPTLTEQPRPGPGRLGGQKVFEYLVMPQQTGSFTFPELVLPYFDPRREMYDEARSQPVTISVVPGAGGAVSGNGHGGPSEAEKNKLSASPLKGLRYQASFAPTNVPLWRRAFFLPGVLAPPVLFFGLLAAGWTRAALGKEDPVKKKRRQAKAARARLKEAEALLVTGKADAFYAEVEKALLNFLEAKLGMGVGGLTREGLAERLRAAGISEARARAVLLVLERCDVGRFAPGVDGQGREQVLELAASAMAEGES